MPSFSDATYSTVVWPNWVDCTYTPQASNTSDFVWTNWTNYAATNTSYTLSFQRTVTPEEQALAVAESCRTRRQAQEDARQRSLELLLSVLSDTQLAEYNDQGRFRVKGSSGRTYVIVCEGQQGNVQWWRDGVFASNFCAHPGGDVPDPDAWLAQKLALEADDEAFLMAANLRRGVFPPESARAQLNLVVAA